MAMLEVRDLRISYRQGGRDIMAVDGASLSVPRGSITGIVGESGCGKTTLGRAIIGVMASNAAIVRGQILFEGRDLAALPAAQQRQVRWREIAFVPQSAMNSLNPVYRVGDQLGNILVARGGCSRAEAGRRRVELFKSVGLSAQRLDDFPHQFSGGMRQRAAIAMALALHPKLIVADEPVTALDVLVQKQILDLLVELRSTHGISIIMVTHDIGVVGYACDRVAVMYGGQIVEHGRTEEVLANQAHPYTMGLLQAFPDLGDGNRDLVPINGIPPDLANPPPGCRFEPRCPFAIERCLLPVAPRPATDGHMVACCRASESAQLLERAQQAATWIV
ncbi:ABC transporter ATP-binding protein [Mesorhizobium sp. INR15]|uniref:ABC transporter ATP-binding protein n=1 Tax=Mesorhizobium sp. INR15 TaxID=2654248 RepID=UPI001896A309|nr:ABC transporter ATP-binding protein [Mesorhizobium sp. INR15]QPC90748.1 ATP-binding cassette domain-containing protein [Mesorhizobium sp. INR15]